MPSSQGLPALAADTVHRAETRSFFAALWCAYQPLAEPAGIEGPFGKGTVVMPVCPCARVPVPMSAPFTRQWPQFLRGDTLAPMRGH